MKPAAQTIERQSDNGGFFRRRFPLVDYNYQSFPLDRFRGDSGEKRGDSFFDISRDYFQREAGRNFLAEVSFFLVLVAILAGTFIEGARIIIHFLHLPPA